MEKLMTILFFRNKAIEICLHSILMNRMIRPSLKIKIKKENKRNDRQFRWE